jgi:hypothetical protein
VASCCSRNPASSERTARATLPNHHVPLLEKTLTTDPMLVEILATAKQNSGSLKLPRSV